MLERHYVSILFIYILFKYIPILKYMMVIAYNITVFKLKYFSGHLTLQFLVLGLGRFMKIVESYKTWRNLSGKNV